MKKLFLLFSLAGALLAGFSPPVFAAGCPLCEAVKQNDAKLVRKLLSHGADPNLITKGRGSVLAFAAYKGQTEVVKALLAGGANPNQNAGGRTEGATALMFAARFGREDIIKILLKNGARVNHAAANGDTALIWAAVRDELEAAEILLDGGANPNLAGNNGAPLTAAAKEGHIYMIKLLRKRGAELTMRQTVEGIVGAMLAGNFAAAEVLWKN